MSKVEELINYFDGYVSLFDGLIISLAKMQIPMKLIGETTTVKALDIERQEVRTYKCTPCPSCEKWITKVYNFCPHCGQCIEE